MLFDVILIIGFQVCGFGYTEECAKTKCTEVSEVLRYARVKAIYLDDCLQRIRELENTTDHHTLKPDKFCLGSGSGEFCK